MDKIIHPITGEEGYFCTVLEKKIIDASIENSIEHQSNESAPLSVVGADYVE